MPQLEEAAKAGVEAMLALPAPAKKAVATKAAEPASEPAPAAATEPAAATATPEEWLERSRALAEKSEQAEAAAMAAIAAERRIPPEITTEEVVTVVAKRDDAEAVLRALAKQLGFRLVLAHAKKAA